MTAAHLFLSADGDLFDTRQPEWKAQPLRRRFCYRHAMIETLADLKATLRAGRSSDLAGYPLFFVTWDDQILSFSAVLGNWPDVVASYLHRNRRDGWGIVGCGVNYEGGDLRCAHTGKRIPSAYAEAEIEEET